MGGIFTKSATESASAEVSRNETSQMVLHKSSVALKIVKEIQEGASSYHHDVLEDYNVEDSQQRFLCRCNFFTWPSSEL